MRRLIINKNEPTIQMLIPGKTDNYRLAVEILSVHTHVTVDGSTVVNTDYRITREVGAAVRVTVSNEGINLKVFVEGEKLIDCKVDQVCLSEYGHTMEIWEVTNGYSWRVVNVD